MATFPAPIRRAIRAESIATFPPPMTATRFPERSIFPPAFPIASSSIDSRTPESSRPDTSIPCPSIVPRARNAASNPWSFREAMDPTDVPVRISTPRAVTFRMSRSTSSLGSRNGGMPWRSIPPASGPPSNTVTPYPLRARKYAADSPAGPEPTTATVFPFRASGGPYSGSGCRS